jgi:hypothetical protein
MFMVHSVWFDAFAPRQRARAHVRTGSEQLADLFITRSSSMDLSWCRYRTERASRLRACAQLQSASGVLLCAEPEPYPGPHAATVHASILLWKRGGMSAWWRVAWPAS